MPNKWFLKETTAQLKNITFNKLDKFAEILKEETEDGAPGRIEIVVRKSRIRQNVTVAATHPESNLIPVYVEFGTAPHEIKAKNAKALR